MNNHFLNLKVLKGHEKALFEGLLVAQSLLKESDEQMRAKKLALIFETLEEHDRLEIVLVLGDVMVQLASKRAVLGEVLGE